MVTLADDRPADQPARRPHGRAARWLTLGAAALLAITTACSGGDKVTAPGTPGPPPATPVGSYTLNTVDAKTLPWTMYADTGYTLEIQSGTLSITVNGKWVSKVVTRETVAGFASTYNDSTFGSWAVATGSTIAVLTNAETNTTSSATWTATEATVVQLDGATSRTIKYRKN